MIKGTPPSFWLYLVLSQNTRSCAKVFTADRASKITRPIFEQKIFNELVQRFSGGSSFFIVSACDPPLTLSDRTENFAAGRQYTFTQVEASVSKNLNSFLFYSKNTRTCNWKTGFFSGTSRIFWIKQERIEIFENARFYLCKSVLSTSSKIFSPIGQS